MQLENYATAHKRQLEQYELTEAQLAYTDYPNNNIQQASDKHHPIVFQSRSAFSCYFALQEHHEFESYNTQFNIIVTLFSTDTRFYIKDMQQQLCNICLPYCRILSTYN